MSRIFTYLTIIMVIVTPTWSQFLKAATLKTNSLNTIALKTDSLNTIALKDTLINDNAAKPRISEDIRLNIQDDLKSDYNDATIQTINTAAARKFDYILINKLTETASIALKTADYKSFITAQNAIDTKTWIARIAEGIDYSEISLSALIGASVDETDPNIATSAPPERLLASYPFSYDLRSAYPGCWSISYIRHQGQCGSCWAVAGATSLSDRTCTYKPFFWFLSIIQITKRSYSYQDPLECCSASVCGTGPNKGCNGGQLVGPFKYGVQTGIVTGENYGNTTNCKNYFLSPWAGTATAPSCKLYCTTSGYGKTYAADKRKISGYTVYSKNSIGSSGVAKAMQSAIYNRGTVSAYLDVYNDFFAYSQGVYTKSVGAVFKGGHAVRVIGWGSQSIINFGWFKIALGPYWIAANSWGTNWGINGFFYIRRGSNEVNIESYVVEGYVN